MTRDGKTHKTMGTAVVGCNVSKEFKIFSRRGLTKEEQVKQSIWKGHEAVSSASERSDASG